MAIDEERLRNMMTLPAHVRHILALDAEKSKRSVCKTKFAYSQYVGLHDLARSLDKSVSYVVKEGVTAVVDGYIDGLKLDYGSFINGKVPLDLFINLSFLSVVRSNLKSLDTSHNLKLLKLVFSYNLVSSLDVSCNSELRSLNCSHNLLEELDLSNNPNLTYLHSHGNNLSKLFLLDNPKLKKVSVNTSVNVQGYMGEVEYV